MPTGSTPPGPTRTCCAPRRSPSRWSPTIRGPTSRASRSPADRVPRSKRLRRTHPMATAKKTAAAKKAAAPVKKAAPAKRAGTTAAAARRSDGLDIPAPKGTTKDGIAYTKDFDVKFLKAQHDALIAERELLLGQANRLEDEANSLIEDTEMGDVQFDDESGE